MEEAEVAPVEPDFWVTLEQYQERLKGKVSNRKGWLLLAGTVDWWASPAHPWNAGANEVSLADWRAMILAESEGRVNPDTQERLAEFAQRLKEASIRQQDFEAAACWLDFQKSLRRHPSRPQPSRCIPRGLGVLPELGMLSSDLFGLYHELFDPHLRPVRLDPAWLPWQAGTVPAIARRIYDSDDFSDLSILADALEDAGCEETAVLEHCRDKGRHVRGCWVVDWCLGLD